ncbi:MAG: hypothetical protein HQ522_01725 [Bacteroidetes bacterium]|nr:hypothetical protein [Bacteroidota bacterium]
MLFKPSDIIKQVYVSPREEGNKQQAVSLTESGSGFSFVDENSKPLTLAIGELEQGKSTHYYSYGNFNLVRLMLYIIKQTGPVHAFMTSYSFSQKSIEQIQRRLEQNLLLSFRVIIDNRVRSLSPKPFQMLMESFDYRCSSIHAKVALLWNDKWKISIVTSQNATDNPKLERGTIFTDHSVFNFDLNALENEYQRGNL